MIDGDPHDEIERLEDEIEDLTARIANCRKFILAGQIAMIGGGLALVAMLFGVIRPDLTVMVSAMAAVIGGIVVSGTNNSTAKEAEKEVAKAEASRAILIGQIELRVVGGSATLH